VIEYRYPENPVPWWLLEAAVLYQLLRIAHVDAVIRAWRWQRVLDHREWR
jgi:hypothetical protein